MKTINQRNEALLKLQNLHAKCAGESKKDTAEIWKKLNFHECSVVGLKHPAHLTMQTTVGLYTSISLPGLTNVQGSSVFTKIERKVTVKYVRFWFILYSATLFEDNKDKDSLFIWEVVSFYITFRTR